MTDFTQLAQESATLPSTHQSPFCTNCGNAVSEQAIACMSCGARPIGHKKNCRQCGVALNPEQIVCIKCGSAVNTAGIFNPLAMSSGFNAAGVTPGDVTVFCATALAFISFIMPWMQATIPVIGTLSRNGFSTYAFLLGLVFVLPVCVTLAKNRAISWKVFGYIGAGIGIIAAIVYPLILIDIEISKLDSWQREAARELTSTGAGAYVFILACIILIVGIVLQPRQSDCPNNRVKVATIYWYHCVFWRCMISFILLSFPATIFGFAVAYNFIQADSMGQLVLVGIGILSMIGGLIGIIAMILHFVLLYQLWKVVPINIPSSATPGQAVGFLFIPIFNLYWMLVAYKELDENMSYALYKLGYVHTAEAGWGMRVCILLYGYLIGVGIQFIVFGWTTPDPTLGIGITVIYYGYLIALLCFFRSVSDNAFALLSQEGQ